MSKKKVLTPSEFAQIKNPVITSVRGCSFADDVYGRVFVMRTEVKQVHHNPNDLIAMFV